MRALFTSFAAVGHLHPLIPLAAPARPRWAQEGSLATLQAIWDRRAPGRAARRVGEVYLDACPGPFQTDDIEPIAGTAQVVHVRPGLFDGPPESPAPFLSELAAPAAYVTLGTVPQFSTPSILRAVALAVADAVTSVVVTSGPNSPESLGPLPAHVHVERYLPQSAVLPNVDLFVSHGGAGGTVAALVHGLPHLVLAGAGMSQRTNAAAVERAGVGISLPVERRSDDDVRDVAARLLTDPAYAGEAGRIGMGFAALPGPADVVRLVEERAGLQST